MCMVGHRHLVQHLVTSHTKASQIETALAPFSVPLCPRLAQASLASSVSRVAMELTLGPTVVLASGSLIVSAPEPAPVLAAWHAPRAPDASGARSVRSCGTAAAATPS